MNELDIAELRHEMRQMYKEIGYAESLACLREIILSGNVLVDVIIEEVKKERGEKV